MRLITASLLCLTTLHVGWAADSTFESTVKEAQSFAKAKKSEAFGQIRRINPHDYFNHYTAHPDQTEYYRGDAEQMKNEGRREQNTEKGAPISDSIKHHPRFVIHAKDQDMQHSQLIQREANNILHGVINQYIDCKPKQSCTTQYRDASCDEAPQRTFQTCKKKLVVEVIPSENSSHHPITAYLTVKKHDYAGVVVDAVHGTLHDLRPQGDAQFRLEGRLPADIDCKTWQGTITARQGNARLDYIGFPACSNGSNLDFHISGGHQLTLHIDMVSKWITYDTQDHWVDDCADAASDETCKLKSQQCTIPTSTQVIQGLPVTRDCWEYQSHYICHRGHGQGNCKPLQAQGCEQVSSSCQDQNNGNCALYRQTYRCPIQACSATTDVICGDGKEYCLEGDCTDHRYAESQDFVKAVSALSAAVEAGKELDQSTYAIFAGHSVECSEKPVGYSNCCTMKGWGQDIGLDRCPEDAKQLHVERENKLAVKVGRYCSGPGPFPCIEHSQVFCVFNSKLAKIIQEKGRARQLGINFGSAKQPICRGITPGELQQINFTKINFTDFISDLDNIKKPDLEHIQKMIEQHIEEDRRTGKADG